MGERTIEDAKRDLLHVLPHIKLAMAQGETMIEGGTAGLGIKSRKGGAPTLVPVKVEE